MDEQGIRQLLRDLDARAVETIGQWVMCSCPLSPWTHESRHDARPSFGISIKPDATSIYHCFTCKGRDQKGTLIQLLERLSSYDGENYSDLIENLGPSEELGPPLRATKTISRARQRSAPLEPVDESFIDMYEDPFDYPAAASYLTERGVGPSGAALCELRFDPDNHGVPRILFPVRGLDGKLYGFSGRAINDASLRVRDYHGLAKKQLLLGAHLLPTDRYAIVVEGLFDYAYLRQLGYPAVAVLHSNMTDEQAAILIRANKPVYLMYDNDSAGRDGQKVAAEKLRAHIPTHWSQYPESEEPIKDPAVLYSEEVSGMIGEAVLV